MESRNTLPGLRIRFGMPGKATGADIPEFSLHFFSQDRQLGNLAIGCEPDLMQIRLDLSDGLLLVGANRAVVLLIIDPVSNLNCR